MTNLGPTLFLTPLPFNFKVLQITAPGLSVALYVLKIKNSNDYQQSRLYCSISYGIVT